MEQHRKKIGGYAISFRKTAKNNQGWKKSSGIFSVQVNEEGIQKGKRQVVMEEGQSKNDSNKVGICKQETGTKHSAGSLQMYDTEEETQERPSNSNRRIREVLKRFISRCYRKLKTMGMEMASMSAGEAIQPQKGRSNSTWSIRGNQGDQEVEDYSQIEEDGDGVIEQDSGIGRKELLPQCTQGHQIQGHMVKAIYNNQSQEQGPQGITKSHCGYVRVAISNISGMGIRTNKMQRVMKWMEENKYDILLAQEANVLWPSICQTIPPEDCFTKLPYCVF